ncbi:unnamed protein product [Symbiodinium sp. CCMP2592]|nr:unnamed protein product [Symbiodinium sp. CCMP2592]
MVNPLQTFIDTISNVIDANCCRRRAHDQNVVEATSNTNSATFLLERRVRELEIQHQTYERIIASGVVHIDHDPSHYLPVLLSREQVQALLSEHYELPRYGRILLAVMDPDEIEVTDEMWRSLRAAYLPHWNELDGFDDVKKFVPKLFASLFPVLHFRLTDLPPDLDMYLGMRNLVGFDQHVMYELITHIEEEVKPDLPMEGSYVKITKIANEFFKRKPVIPVKYRDTVLFEVNFYEHRPWTFREITEKACEHLAASLPNAGENVFNPDFLYLKDSLSGSGFPQDMYLPEAIDRLDFGHEFCFVLEETLRCSVIIKDLCIQVPPLRLNRVETDWSIELVVQEALRTADFPYSAGDVDKFRVELNGCPIQMGDFVIDLDYSPEMTFEIIRITKPCFLRVTVANMEQRTFEMASATPSWSVRRLKEAGLHRFFHGNWDRRSESPNFMIHLRRTGAVIEDELVKLDALDYTKDDTFEITARQLGGGRKRTHAEMEDVIGTAMSAVSPSNPFATTLRSLIQDVNTNGNVITNLVGQLGAEQTDALDAAWNELSQNDVGKIVDKIWPFLRSDFLAIYTQEQHIKQAKRVITLLLEKAYVREFSEGGNILHRRVTHLIQNRYDELHAQIREHQIENEVQRRVAELVRHQSSALPPAAMDTADDPSL